MKLLNRGSSNWSYYYSSEDELVYAVAKEGSGAATSIYGSLKYYTKQLKAGRL